MTLRLGKVPNITTPPYTLGFMDYHACDKAVLWESFKKGKHENRKITKNPERISGFVNVTPYLRVFIQQLFSLLLELPM